jgi:hypothetical protein
MRIRDNPVRIATGYALNDRKLRIFSPPQRPGRLWASPSLSKGYRGLFAWIKRSGREADHSPSTSAEVNKTWICTSTPPCLHGVVLSQCTETALPLNSLRACNHGLFCCWDLSDVSSGDPVGSEASRGLTPDSLFVHCLHVCYWVLNTRIVRSCPPMSVQQFIFVFRQMAAVSLGLSVRPLVSVYIRFNASCTAVVTTFF